MLLSSLQSILSLGGEKTLFVSAPEQWNHLQQVRKLSSLVHFGEFKGTIGRLEKATVGVCNPN